MRSAPARAFGLTIVLLTAAVSVKGCALVATLMAGDGSAGPSGAVFVTDSVAATAAPVTSAPADCPVTMPGPAPAEFAERLFGSGSAVGNDDLWVGGLGPGGDITADPRMVRSDGAITWKLGWWRVTPGALTITGQRLDGPSAPLVGEAPDGYGSSGFQASGVMFPSPGCWEVTGTVGGASLTFVTFVEAA